MENQVTDKKAVNQSKVTDIEVGEQVVAIGYYVPTVYIGRLQERIRPSSVQGRLVAYIDNMTLSIQSVRRATKLEKALK